MRLGHGSRRRSLWWWGVALVAATLTLPGAALVGSAAEESPDGVRTEPHALGSTGYAAKPAGAVTEPGHPNRVEAISRNGLGRSRRRPEVHAATGMHELLAAQGIPLIKIQAHFITCPPKTIDSIGANWTILPTEVPEAETPQGASFPPARIDPPPHSTGRSRAQTVIERDLPVMFEILDDRRTDEILDHMRSDRRANVLQAPSVTVFSGQHSFISDSSRSPFVVGLKDGKPQVRVISEGLRVFLCPVFCGGYDTLNLDCRLTLSDVRDVETFTFARAGGKSASIQIPEVETSRWEASVKMPVGKSLLIGGLKKRDERGDPLSMLVMLRTEKITPGEATANEAETYTRVYGVADLVVERPESVVIQAAYHEPSAPPPAEVPVDFDPLVELITTTVAPDTWEVVGGPGSIKPFHTNLSLVVEQTEEVHEQIADLLEQLRRFQDVQVLLETEIVRAPEDVIRRLGYHFVSGDYAPLTPDRARMFREGIRISDHASARRLPKAALFDGQLAQVAVSPQPDDQSAGAGKLSLQAVIDHDRRRVRLTFAGDGGDGKSATAGRTTIVEAGHSLLLDVTGQSGTAGGPTGVPFLRQVPHVARLFGEAPAAASTERTLVLVTPTIVIQEEEEERLGLAPK